MRYLILLSFFISFSTLIAQDTNDSVVDIEHRSYTTQRLENAPKIDGILDDDCWSKIEWQTDFTVNRPNNGEAPSKQTKFKILYDDDYLYIGFRAIDG